jgi:hypothetical protein
MRWQKEMRARDEQQRIEVIQRRSKDPADMRRRTMKMKKDRIQEQLGLVQQGQVAFEKEFAEIDAERRATHELKAQLLDRPKVVVKVRPARIEITRHIKKSLWAEFREEARRRTLEIEKVKPAAQRVREQARTHTIRKGYPFAHRRTSRKQPSFQR